MASLQHNLKQPPQLILKAGDSKYLTKLQIKKAQFLFENDYFIWNEAEMYLRYHDIFTTIPDSDILYEDLCKTTRVIFNLIHDVHYAGAAPNVAYLKFHELLDAWGGLSEYLRLYGVFPRPFLEWFNTIFLIYQSRDPSTGLSVVLFDHLVSLYAASGLAKEEALSSYFKITNDNKFRLTFEYIIEMAKEILLSNVENNRFHLLVPKLQDMLTLDKVEKPYEKVLRNYDFNKVGKSYSKANLATTEKIVQVTKPVFITDIYTSSSKSASDVPINQSTFNQLTIPVKTEFNNKHLSDIYEQMKLEDAQFRSFDSKSPKINGDSYEINDQYFQASPTDKMNKIPDTTPIKFPEIESLYQHLNVDTDVLRSDSINNNDIQMQQNSSNSLSFKSQFRLADFRREFKRSVNDLNKNLSKSINALDYLGKLTLDTSSNEKAKLSTSSSSDCRFNKTLDETLLRKTSNTNKSYNVTMIDVPAPKPRIQVVHTNMSNVPIRDLDQYGLSTSFSSKSNFEIRVPKNIESSFYKSNPATATPESDIDINNTVSGEKPVLVSLGQEPSVKHNFYSPSSSSSTSSSSSESSVSQSNESIKKVPININQTQQHQLQQQSPLPFLETQVSASLKASINEASASPTACSNKHFKSSLKKQSKYENTDIDQQQSKSMQQREFKARSISTMTPRQLEMSFRQQQSPNVSYRNSSYDPKSYPRATIKMVNSGRQQTMHTRHQQLHHSNPPRGSRSVRYELSMKDHSERNGHSTFRSDTQKSRFKELDSHSSLDTLNDIDTENINTQNVDDERSQLNETQYESNYDNYNYYGGYYNGNGNVRNVFDQEWSYSLKENSQCFSVSDQRIINEVLRKLKPIVKKNIKKQIKYYMEKRMLKELKKTGFMLSKDTTASFTNLEEF